MNPDRPEPDAILCPRCGYPLGSAPDADACPECGTPAEMADPAYRIGSAWQRRPGLMSWLGTGASLVRWNHAFDLIRLDPGSATWLSRINHAIAALLVSLALAFDSVKPILIGATHARPTHALGALLIFIPTVYLVLTGLTRIERIGLRFFGNRRGGRITPSIAASVCAHASFGWIIAGLLALIFAGLAWTVFKAQLNLRLAGWLLGAVPRHILGTILGLFLGMLVFETLSYLGAMRCRFANLSVASGESQNDQPPALEPTL